LIAYPSLDVVSHLAAMGFCAAQFFSDFSVADRQNCLALIDHHAQLRSQASPAAAYHQLDQLSSNLYLYPAQIMACLNPAAHQPSRQRAVLAI
jgi:hypothetical protein